MLSSTAAVAFIIVVLVVGSLAAYAIFEWSRHHALSRTTRAQLTTSDEYRRLSEMAITAQEHTDLKLAEINMQLTQLREQLDEVQKVLKDVE
jgi:type II secretory pathway pseudopilin PulG